MQSGSELAVGVTAVSGFVVLAVVVLAMLWLKSLRWSALAAGLASLAFIPAAVSHWTSGWLFVRFFQHMAAAGQGTTPATVDVVTRHSWMAVRVGWGWAALIMIVAVAGSSLRSRPAPPRAEAAPRPRIAVLFLSLLPALGLLACAWPAYKLRQALGVTSAVVADVRNDTARRAAVTRYLDSQGLPSSGAGVIKAVSERVAWASIIAGAGGFGAATWLIASGVIGLVTAWRAAGAAPPAAVVALVACVVVVAGGLIALGFGAPPRF